MSAFFLLKMSAKSWYSKGTLVRSMVSLGDEESERAVERAETELRKRANWTEPSNLQARWKAAALMKEIFRHISPGALGNSGDVVSKGVSRVSEAVHLSLETEVVTSELAFR